MAKLQSVRGTYDLYGMAKKKAKKVVSTASEVVEKYGFEEEDFLKAGKYLNDGNIGFCYRSGNHYFSRDDWHGLFDFMNK